MICNTARTARSIRARLFDVIPAASFQMEKLLGLLDVVLTETVRSAAVECRRSPRLLLNPRFVEKHCRRDEHLFLLVMHELQHVILGHTRLFPRPTEAHNIAFDAVINASLCRQFPAPEYVSFFQEINDWKGFPARLLRPAPGWPEAPEPLPEDASPLERRVHARLYGDEHGQVTYLELFELLVPEIERRLAALAPGTSGAPGSGAPEEDERYAPGVLLGDHGPDELGREGRGEGEFDPEAVADPTLREVLRRIVEAWPPPPWRIAGRDLGGQPDRWLLRPAARAPLTLEKALRRLLARTGILGGAGRAHRRLERTPTPLRVETVLPQARDRRAHAWKLLNGRAPLLWRRRREQPRPRLLPRPIAHVYLDISGSMSGVLPHLAAALRGPHREGLVRLFVFSTVVDEVGAGDLKASMVENTLGTEIDCVLEHLRAIPPASRPHRALILTDGYVGRPAPELLEGLRVELHAGIVEGPWGQASWEDLEGVAKTITSLPQPPTRN